jgi:hypothetical protein
MAYIIIILLLSDTLSVLYCACLTQWNSPKSATPVRLKQMLDEWFQMPFEPRSESFKCWHGDVENSMYVLFKNLWLSSQFFQIPQNPFGQGIQETTSLRQPVMTVFMSRKSKMLINHMLLLFIFSKCSLITAMLSERPCRFPAWVHLHWYFSPMCLPLCALLFCMIILTHILKWWRSFLKAQDQRN